MTARSSSFPNREKNIRRTRDEHTRLVREAGVGSFYVGVVAKRVDEVEDVR